MATKFFLDWADFAMPNQALDIFKQSLRDTIKYDFYGERETFKAIALTNSEPLSNIEAIGLGAGAKGSNLGSAKKHKFKARIIDPNSPHMFLPDPCDLSATKNKEAVVSAIQQHTDIIQINAVATTQLVSRGDIVEIQLKKNVFCYDLQVGIFNRILGKNNTTDSLLKSIGCTSLPGTYGYLTLATGPLVLANNLDTALIPIIPGTTRTGPAKITPGLGEFLLALTTMLSPIPNPSAPGAPTWFNAGIEITSGHRTATEQAVAMKKDVWGATGGGIPGSVSAPARTVMNNLYSCKGCKPWIDPLVDKFESNTSDEDIGAWVQKMQIAGLFRNGHSAGRAVDIKTKHYNFDQIKKLCITVDAALKGYADSKSLAMWQMEPLGSSYWKKNRTVNIEVAGTRPTGGFKNEHLHIRLPENPAFPRVPIPGVK